MELLSLRTFQTVVDEGGILAASRKLNTVQSNVTARIRRLEEELGTELFFRRGRNLELAPSGRVLLDYARRMLRLEHETSQAVRMAGESVGEIRVGATETITALHLPTALKALYGNHPRMEARVRTDTSGHLVEAVLAHSLDCAFVAGPVHQAGIIFREIAVEELVQVHARGTDPQRLPLILFREGCAYRARALAWQRHLDTLDSRPTPADPEQAGGPSREAMEFGTLEGIMGCVAVGLGWTLMPRPVVAKSAHAGDLVVKAIPAEFALIPIGMVYAQDTVPLPAVETLARALSAHGPIPGQAVN